MKKNQFIFGIIGGDVYQDIDHNFLDIVGRFDTKEQASAAAIAINSHDKLIEQNKMMREALSLVIDKIPMNQNIYGGGYMLLLSHNDCRILRETLNISELA